MQTRSLRRAAALLCAAFALTVSAGASAGTAAEKEPEPACSEDCWQLAHLTLRGSVSGGLTFELRGTVLAKEDQKIPLFGPPSQVRLDDLSMDGGAPNLTFDSDRYYLVTHARTFVLRGRITLGADQMLSVTGPLLALDAPLTKGRLVEGEKLSGLAATVLHFDPMTEGASAPTARPKAPPVFRLSRSIRFGSDTSFVYRLVASQETDLGPITLPLAFGERVQDVQGATGWTVDGTTLVLPTTGHEADVTVSGSLPAAPLGAPPLAFGPDERSAYEWWMIEADPEHRVAVAADAKLVETAQSPIPPTMPGARVYLVQRHQRLEVDARSLVRGDVLAAVARTSKRFVAVTGTGELISDESIAFDNNGLDHLMVTPAGKAMYLSTDGAAQAILHATAAASEVLVPLRPGSHTLRVQALADVPLRSAFGSLVVPRSTYPIATSSMEVTVGLPEHVHPLAVLGGDRVRWAFGRADLVAALLGIAVAGLGFRTNRTRALGAVAMAGLWFVSHEGFVVAGGLLFAVGATFLASRFVHGMRLFAAAGAIAVVALFGGRWALTDGTAAEPAREMEVLRPAIPTPEITHAALAVDGSLDTKAGITPVSLSLPTSERYVQSSRQLVTRERPFDMRIVYVTSALLDALELLWLVLVGALAFLHRAELARLRAAVVARLGRKAAGARGPFGDPLPPF
ncbi:MAG: hypothetical protein JWP97_4830 [Labilithrix sp.]|nr:hypothetical protein [Labilithrix sp.]